jgi:hypothetical protein
MYDVEYRKMQK